MDNNPPSAGDTPLREADKADIETMFYRTLNACPDLHAFEDRIGELLRDMGFDTFAWILLGTAGNRLRKPKWLCTNLPGDLVAEYDAKGHFDRQDIALDYAFHNSRAIFYSELQAALIGTPFETEAKLVNREILNLYRSFGFYDFYLLPMQRDGRVTLFMVGACETNEAGFTRKVADNISVTVQMGME